jgi:hypothetical protein
LITFPNGASISVYATSVTVSQPGVGTWTAPIPALPSGSFSHVGFTFGPNATDFYLNGFGLATTNLAFPNLFNGTTTTLGAVSGVGGFRGWVDDLKVIFRAPTVEEECNHARGTIVSIIPGANTAAYEAQAAIYPTSVHDAIAASLGAPGTKYICYHDYAKDLQAPIPPLSGGTGIVSERARLLKLPVFHFGQPRPPGMTLNGFCLGCHQSVQVAATLRPLVLQFTPGVNLEDDVRRQPMQPPRLVSANVPAQYVTLHAPFLPPSAVWGVDMFLDQAVYP